jgi:hypothetical protein
MKKMKKHMRELASLLMGVSNPNPGAQKFKEAYAQKKAKRKARNAKETKAKRQKTSNTTAVQQPVADQEEAEEEPAANDTFKMIVESDTPKEKQIASMPVQTVRPKPSLLSALFAAKARRAQTK